MALIAMLNNTTTPCGPNSMGGNRWGPPMHSGSTPCLWIEGTSRRQVQRRGKRASMRRIQQQQRASARDAVSIVQEWCKWAIDMVALGYEALHPPALNLLPLAQAQPPGEVCDVQGDCDGSVPAHATIDELRRFVGNKFTLRESTSLKKGPHRSLDGIVILIGDPAHGDASVRKEIHGLVHFLYRRGDFHFIECVPERVPKSRGLWRGIEPPAAGGHGGTIGIDDDALWAASLPPERALIEARRELLGHQLRLLGHAKPPGGGSLEMMEHLELDALEAKLGNELEKRKLRMKLHSDPEYIQLDERRVRLGQVWLDSVRKLADQRSIEMARRIASHVNDSHPQADRRAPSGAGYIATVGTGHLDVMLDELQKQGIADVLVLCHAQSLGLGHAALCDEVGRPI